MRVDTLEKFLKIAREKHNNFYSYDNLEYKGTSQIGIITCPVHGDYKQRLSDHIHKKAGCIKCSGKKFRNLENFIEDSVKMYGNKYDYSLVEFVAMRKKVSIKCNRCGEFFNMTPFSHLQGQGCYTCNTREFSESRKLSLEVFIKKAIEIHSNKYIYDEVKYKNSGQKVKIICPSHGHFFQTPGNHLSGHGCFKCMRENLEEKLRKSDEEILENLIKIYDGILYDFEIVLKEGKPRTLNNINIFYTCPKHGRLYSSYDSLVYCKSGCTVCIKSSGEISIYNFLKNNNIDFIYEHSFPDLINPKTNCKLYFDFYLPSKNMCIEFDGQQHFRPIKYFGGEEGFKKTQFRDKLKNQYCKEKDISLLRIKHDQYFQIEKILMEKLYE